MEANVNGETETQRRSYPGIRGQFGTRGWELVRELDLLGNAPRIAEEAQKTAQTCSMPKQSDSDHVLPDADRLVLEILERDKTAPGYALAVARGLAAHLGDDYPEMPGFLQRTTEPTAPAPG